MIQILIFLFFVFQGKTGPDAFPTLGGNSAGDAPFRGAWGQRRQIATKVMNARGTFNYKHGKTQKFIIKLWNTFLKLAQPSEGKTTLSVQHKKNSEFKFLIHFLIFISLILMTIKTFN